MSENVNKESIHIGSLVQADGANPAGHIRQILPYGFESFALTFSHTLEVTKDCIVEIILKHTHTCDNLPERRSIWSGLANDLVTGCFRPLHNSTRR